MRRADLQLFRFLKRTGALVIVLLLGIQICRAADAVASLTTTTVAVSMAPSSAGIIVDAALTTFSGNMDLSLTSSVFFRGKNASSMIFDGQGFFMQMPRSGGPFLQVAAGKKVVLRNIVLKDFSPEDLSLQTGASLVFGDNVYLRLSDTTQPLTTSWVFDGNGAVVDGRGGALQLQATDAILVNDTKDVTFKNIRLLGMKSTQTAHRLRCAGASSKIIFDETLLMVDSFLNLTQGNVVMRNNVTVRGLGSTFAWTSAGTMRLDPFACLKFDYGTTFSYDASSKVRTNLVFSDASALLHMNQATLHATRSGLLLSTGSMYFENIVTLESEAQTVAEALVIDKSLQAFVPNGSTVAVKGKVVYQ